MVYGVPTVFTSYPKTSFCLLCATPLQRSETSSVLKEGRGARLPGARSYWRRGRPRCPPPRCPSGTTSPPARPGWRPRGWGWRTATRAVGHKRRPGDELDRHAGHEPHTHHHCRTNHTLHLTNLVTYHCFSFSIYYYLFLFMIIIYYCDLFMLLIFTDFYF